MFSSIEQIVDAHKNYKDITSEGFAIRLITLFGKGGMYEQACELLDELAQLKWPLTVNSLNALLSVALDSGRPAKVPELFQKLPSELSIAPDHVTYNILILALCRMDRLDEAVSVMETMDAKGVEPTVITFNALLHAFNGVNRFLDAEKLLEKMAERNVSPDVVTFNEKMQALARNGKSAEVLQLFDEMRCRSLKPDIHSFNALIKAYCSDGNIEEAMKVFTDLATHDCAPNYQTHQTIIPYICEPAEYDMALNLAKAKCYLDEAIMRSRRNVVEELASMSEDFMLHLQEEQCENLVAFDG